MAFQDKFGDRYLAKELHYDADESFGTAFPIQEIGSVPENILLLDRLGSYDLNTDRQVEFDKPVSDGGKGWYYLDTGESDQNIRACSKHNQPLFDYLDKFDY